MFKFFISTLNYESENRPFNALKGVKISDISLIFTLSIPSFLMVISEHYMKQMFETSITCSLTFIRFDVITNGNFKIFLHLLYSLPHGKGSTCLKKTLMIYVNHDNKAVSNAIYYRSYDPFFFVLML